MLLIILINFDILTPYGVMGAFFSFANLLVHSKSATKKDSMA